tara:strand:- start:1984 stop:2154 length:171 start_codon:yes stop_codon:yes gene_type:complete
MKWFIQGRALLVVIRIEENQAASSDTVSAFSIEVVFSVENAVLLIELLYQFRGFLN